MFGRYSLPRRPPTNLSLETDAVRLPDGLRTASTRPPDGAIYVNDVWQIFWPVLSDVGKMAKTSGVLPITPYPRIPADLCDHSIKLGFSPPGMFTNGGPPKKLSIFLSEKLLFYAILDSEKVYWLWPYSETSFWHRSGWLTSCTWSLVSIVRKEFRK